MKYLFGYVLCLVLFFSLCVGINAQSDDFVLEWEQHWETFGIGGTCNYGTHNFFLGDVDNDGVEELITGGFMYLMENGSRISFEAPLRIWSWDGNNLTCEMSHDWIGSIRAIYASDLDNDGFLEIITGGRIVENSEVLNSIRIWSYDGNNIVAKGSFNGISASSIFVYDTDRNGDMEVLVAGRSSGDNISFAQLSIFDYKENGLSLLDNVEWCGSVEAYAYSVFADDLDNDGNVEIITGGYDYDLTNSCGQLRIWNWNGMDLSLESSEEWRLVENVYGVTISGLPMGNTVINNVKVGDLDHDGQKEVVSGGWAYDGEFFNAQLRIWNWNGTGFGLETSHEWVSEDITEIKSISLDDVDLDGDIEVVTCGLTSVYGSFNNTESVPDHAQLRIFSWKDNNLVLEQAKDWTIGEGVVAWNLVSGDLDKDGDVEIVTVGCMGECGLCDPDLRIWSLDINKSSFIDSQIGIIIILIGICFLGLFGYLNYRRK